MGHCVVPLSLFLGVALAHAAAASPVGDLVLVTPPQADTSELAGQVEQTLTPVLKAELGGRYIADAEPWPAGCAEEAPCLAARAERHEAAHVLLVSASATDAGPRLRLRLLSRAGELVGQAEGPLVGAGGPRAVEALVVQVVAPTRFLGVLRLESATDDVTHVEIDRIPVRGRGLDAPLRLSVGTHELRVGFKGSMTHTRNLEIRYGEEQSVSLAELAPQKTTELVGMPVWPAAVTGTLAAGAALTAVVFWIDGAITGSLASANASALPQVQIVGANPHRFAANFIPTQSTRLTDARAAAQNSYRVGALCTTLALASGGLSALMWFAHDAGAVNSVGE